MFKDISNVFYIRDALWKNKAHSKAAVMVGSGFSFNATPKSFNSPKMPSWSEITNAICETLYPNDENELKDAKKRSSGTSGFLKVAQEFEVAFGKNSLNAKIRALIPDDDHHPGNTHVQLLSLPWSDVFTTNWDTLLERGAKEIVGRNYDIVRSVAEIPMSAQPRIVKLHGSLPAHDPFIFTEEDYRKYQVDFAPFVNLVQQSMMENIFCLIGFSGDDPNFLHWSGWVRDNLGVQSPKIYLVGSLNLSVHQRRMLESRNVMPVDLSELPQMKQWPEDKKKQYAIEWFLSTLEIGKPYRKIEWPSINRIPVTNKLYLGDTPSTNEVTPLDENLHSIPSEDMEGKILNVRTIIKTWSHNRSLYSGWVIAPTRVRSIIWENTIRFYNEIVRIIPKLGIKERIDSLAEFIWRLDLSLAPCFDDILKIVEDSILAVFEVAEASDSYTLEVSKYDNYEFRLLILYALKEARRTSNKFKFEKYIQLLLDVTENQELIVDEIKYEKCLWLLYNDSLEALKKEMSEWHIQYKSSIATLRKAGILAELGDDAESSKLISDLINDLRLGRGKEYDGFVSYSLEAWALFLAQAYWPGFEEGSFENVYSHRHNINSRWHELREYDCDASSEIEFLKLELLNETPPYFQKVIKSEFELNRRNVSFQFKSGLPKHILAAYQLISISEMTGIPPRAGNSSLLSDPLSKAATILAKSEPWLALQVTMRISKLGYDKDIDNIISQNSLAQLETNKVDLIYSMLLERAKESLKKAQRDNSLENVSELKSNLEMLSRISIRVGQVELEEIFRFGVLSAGSKYLEDQMFRLKSCLINFFSRIFTSMKFETINKLFPQILDVKLGLFYLSKNQIELIELLPRQFIFKPNKKDAAWIQIITDLISATMSNEDWKRTASSLRLLYLHSWKLLPQKYSKKFNQALWIETQIDEFGLPINTKLLDEAFLEHCNDKKSSNEAIIRKITSILNNEVISKEQVIRVASIYRKSANCGNILILSNEQLSKLNSVITNWLKEEKQIPFEFRLFNQDSNSDFCKAILNLFSLLEHDDILVRGILEKIKMLAEDRSSVFDVFCLFPVLMHALPDERPTLLKIVYDSCLSSDPERAALGAYAIFEVSRDELQITNSDILPNDLCNLLREIGIAIKYRRKTILTDCLNIASYIFERMPNNLKADLLENCLIGLTELLNEANYGPDKELNIPEVRYGCVRLAQAIKNSKLAIDSDTIKKWILEMNNDPLNQIRNFAANKRYS